MLYSVCCVTLDKLLHLSELHEDGDTWCSSQEWGPGGEQGGQGNQPPGCLSLALEPRNSRP